MIEKPSYVSQEPDRNGILGQINTLEQNLNSLYLQRDSSENPAPYIEAQINEKEKQLTNLREQLDKIEEIA